MKTFKLFIVLMLCIVSISIAVSGWGDAPGAGEETEDPEDFTTAKEMMEHGDVPSGFDKELEFTTQEEFEFLVENGLNGRNTEDITLDNGYTIKEGKFTMSWGEKALLAPGAITDENGNEIGGGEMDISEIMDGNIPAANELEHQTPEGDISSGQGIGGFSMLGSDYTIDYADYWETDSHKIVEGHGIQKKGGNIYVDEGHAIDSDDEFVSYANSYESSGNEFSIGEAKAVLLDGTLFTDIKDSYFKTKDGAITEASVTSSTDDNSFTLDGITVEMDENDTFNAKLDEETGKFDLSLDSEQGKIEATYPNVGCVEISPGSRFEYTGSDFDDFALFVPSYGGVYELCIRTLPEENYTSDCSRCGVKDFVNKTAEFNGIYQYEKPSVFEDDIFRNMIDASGNYSMEADNHKFNNTYIFRRSHGDAALEHKAPVRL
ncbi:hypothetical protein Dthio_PD2185 [Desulfonatronospira thiodismutans ASO3-1]|uniref:Lipoprotein n=1 Tax=Desulfonatronospira thiodismutans ASO3-1 TaxID=555779 RepID=D6SPX8_9BACT|nr:hypothetical protein [Desulfonatronospira thiodismutans]EFI34804.1 hypothetical protein Dthio_PD2185 [Desulfonatronospira thiodismutans ASO3-1]